MPHDPPAPLADPPTRPHAARLPTPRGRLSETVCTRLASGSPPTALPLLPVNGALPYGEDLQLALTVCYELHSHGFDGVDPDWEWDPGLLRLRAWMEQRFWDTLRLDVSAGSATLAATAPGIGLERMLTGLMGDAGAARHLLTTGHRWQLREYLAHCSLFHLREPDPYAWALPGLTGQAKAAVATLQFDGYGGGDAHRASAGLYAELLAGAGLDPRYLAHLDRLPAPTLALANLTSLLGLHRARRAALLGHLAASGITRAPSARRLHQVLQRHGAPEESLRFFAAHARTDSSHARMLRGDVLGELLAREPELRTDVLLGVRATELLARRLAHHLLVAWRHGRTSLRRPLPEAPEPTPHRANVRDVVHAP